MFRVRDRERLFRQLDEARECPAVWIAGPPGAGKTSLAASYLKARRLTAIWYDVDAGDADPASFFHYLTQAAPPARSRNAPPLLAFSPEYAPELSTFTRQYFRTFFQRLPPIAVVVFDNCHEVPADAPLNQVLRDLLPEVRAGISILMVSRSDPPAMLAHAQANRVMTRVNGDALRLTDDELREIVDSQVDEATLTNLLTRCNGWAAGLILMLEHLKAAGTLAPARPDETLEGTFNYFAGEVFDRVSAPTQTLLLRTAFLPRVTAAAAAALTADPNAASLLDGLYRQRLFTDQHPGEQQSYQFHALFAEFLRSRVSAMLSPGDLRQLRAQSAQLLEKAGDPAAALKLWVKNEEWGPAIDLIHSQARGLVANGRWLTLEAWIGLLPAAQVEKTPWLSAWLGSALILVDPAKARPILTRAFGALDAAGDARGRVFCATGIVETHNIAQTDHGELDRWIEVLENALIGTGAFRSATERLRVQTAFTIGALLRRPGHPRLPSSLAAVRAAVGQDLPLPARVDAATQVLQYFCWVGDLRSARELVAEVAPLFESLELPPFRRAGWLVFFSYYCVLVGDSERGFAALDRLRAIVQDFGMIWFRYFDLFFRALLELLGPPSRSVSALIQQLGSQVDSTSPVEEAKYQLTRVLHYQVLEEPSLAVYHGELCLDAVRRTASPYFQILFPTIVASAFVEAARPDRALELLGQAQALASGTVYLQHEPLMMLVEAYARLATAERERALDLLARALRRSRAAQSASTFRWLVKGLRRLLAVALTQEVEQDIARALVAEFAIPAESQEIEHWPWPIRIRSLGGFSVSIDGEPLRSQRKAPKKPLELLKFVVAHGAQEVSAGHVMQTLWPDAEGDAAADALEVTLRRLRKLLGREDAIELTDGRLSVNPGRCWLDLWAFGHARNRADALRSQGSPALTDVELEALGERLLALYTGHFLAGEEESAWLLGARERLSSQMYRALAAIGQLWESRGAPERAELLYRRGIELEVLPDSLQPRLIAIQARRRR